MPTHYPPHSEPMSQSPIVIILRAWNSHICVGSPFVFLLLIKLSNSFANHFYSFLSSTFVAAWPQTREANIDIKQLNLRHLPLFLLLPISVPRVERIAVHVTWNSEKDRNRHQLLFFLFIFTWNIDFLPACLDFYSLY